MIRELFLEHKYASGAALPKAAPLDHERNLVVVLRSVVANNASSAMLNGCPGRKEVAVTAV